MPRVLSMMSVVLTLVLASACGGQDAAKPAAPLGTAAAVPPSDSPAAAGDQAAGAAEDLEPEPPDNPAVAAALKPWTGDLDGMVKRGFVRVLTTYSKMTFFVDHGTQMGLVPDAFRMFEDDLNKRLKTGVKRVQVIIVPVAHDDLIPALLQGRGDVVAALKVATAWRREQVDFTEPTRTGISAVVVTAPGVPAVSTVADVGGKEVYLRASDVSEKGVAQFNAQLASAGRPPVTLRSAPEVLADEDILEMVNAGLVQMTMTDDYIAQFWQQVFPDIVINQSAQVRTDGQTAMMLRKNSPQLMKELNGFVSRYPDGSLQRNVLLQKYLKSVKYAKAATSKTEQARLQQTIQFMRKYSSQYSLDYLLMAAQGYQESGLDQAKKSAVGALGVMQVMPATGKDMNVGDITAMESNIHAGVKYMRFMMDRYYADEPMDAVNKGLFTFASYNAGPARIRQLRKRAEARGLNPNLWFNNVEIVAAESIGRETVQYVSNIYKYYLAYTMLTEQEALRQKAKGTQ